MSCTRSGPRSSRICGPWGLLLFVLIAALVPVAGLAEASRAVCRRFPRRWLCGLLSGLTLATGFCTLLFTVPFLGPLLSIPGYPLALELRGDDRLATIWLLTLTINGLTWTAAGLLVALFCARSGISSIKRFHAAVSRILLTIAAVTAVGWLFWCDARAAAEALALRFDALPVVR